MEKALKLLLMDRHELGNPKIVTTEMFNEAIAELEEAMKHKTCEGCKHKPNEGECYYEPCGTCARFFYDHYEPKDHA